MPTLGSTAQPRSRLIKRGAVRLNPQPVDKERRCAGWGGSAKKKAAFMVLVRLFDNAGLGSEKLEKAMWETME